MAPAVVVIVAVIVAAAGIRRTFSLMVGGLVTLAVAQAGEPWRDRVPASPIESTGAITA